MGFENTSTWFAQQQLLELEFVFLKGSNATTQLKKKKSSPGSFPWLKACDLLSRQGHSPGLRQEKPTDPHSDGYTQTEFILIPKKTSTLIDFENQINDDKTNHKFQLLLIAVSGWQSWLRQICGDQELQHPFIGTKCLLRRTLGCLSQDQKNLANALTRISKEACDKTSADTIIF